METPIQQSSNNQYNPFLERNVKHPTTDLETFIHLVKGSLGAGILAMPYAFQHIGLYSGIPGTLLVGFVCSYCIHMLIKASQTLCVRCRLPRLTYAETAEQAFRNDAKEMVKVGVAMSFIVNFFLVLDLLACVCIYLVNVSKNIKQIVDLHAPDNGLSLRSWILIVAVPIIFLCLIRDLKYLVPFSMVANVLMFTGLIITFCFIFSDMPSPSERSAIKEFRHWPTFFGTAIFALECIGVVLPCENEMQTPQHFTGCPSVLVFAMSVVVSLYTVLGFFGYLKYGDAVEANIALNLPTDNAWGQIVKAMVALAIYFTILLQFYVPIQIIWRALQERIPENYQNTAQNIVRISLIIFCTLTAFAFPDLGPFISLIGAICLSTLGLILPAILDLVVFRIDPGYGWLKIHLIKNIFIILFGVVGFIFGTIESIREFDIK